MESKRGLKKKISRKEGKKPMEEAYRSTARPFWKQKCATHLWVQFSVSNYDHVRAKCWAQQHVLLHALSARPTSFPRGLSCYHIHTCNKKQTGYRNSHSRNKFPESFLLTASGADKERFVTCLRDAVQVSFVIYEYLLRYALLAVCIMPERSGLGTSQGGSNCMVWGVQRQSRLPPDLPDTGYWQTSANYRLFANVIHETNRPLYTKRKTRFWSARKR